MVTLHVLLEGSHQALLLLSLNLLLLVLLHAHYQVGDHLVSAGGLLRSGLMIRCQLVVFDLLMRENKLFNSLFELEFECVTGVKVVGKEEGIPFIIGEDVREERFKLALLALLLGSSFLAALVYP